MNQKVKAAKKFLAKVKAKDPILYQTLIDNAEFFLTKDKNDYSASDLRTAFKGILNREPELNPVENPDTYGIKLAIDAVAGDKERDSATSAKRLFGSTLDQVFKESSFQGKYKIYYHVSTEGNLNLSRLGAFSKKHDARGMFVTPSFESIINSWFEWVLNSKGRTKDKQVSSEKYDLRDPGQAHKTYYIYSIAVPKELALSLEDRFNKKAEEKGGGLGAYGWDLEMFIPNEYFNQLKIIKKKKYSYNDFYHISKIHNRKSIENYSRGQVRNQQTKSLTEVFKEEFLLAEEEWRQGGVRFFQMRDTLNPALKNAPARRKKPMKHKSRT